MATSSDSFVRKRSTWKRILSVFLALLTLILCIPAVPSANMTADAWPGFGWGGWPGFGWGGPNVLTNATVKFKDGNGTVIGDVDSGETFKIVITISGNNVHQNPGSNSTKYRVEITDTNLLLTNFKDDGFYDGAKYNGYKLVYDAATGKRYIEFSIRNGSTQTIQLSAKFANGITEDGHTATVKLIDTSTNRSVSSTITANAAFNWTDNKTENVTELQSSDFATGSIQYTLSASPNYVSDGTGEVWATGLAFEDVIELSEGLTFTSAADVKNALSIPGVTISDVKLSGSNTAIVTWTVDSTKLSNGKPYAEMDAFNKTATLNLNCIHVSESFTTGTLGNTLRVGAMTYGSSDYIPLGEKSVQAVVKSNPAKFSEIGKNVAADKCTSSTYSTKGYFVDGDTVAFYVSTKNTGGKAGSVQLIDTIPAGLTYVKTEGVSPTGTVTASGQTVTIQYNSVAAGETAEAYIYCKVDKPTADASLKNTVKNGEGYSADAYVPVKVLTPSISVTKSASTNSILKDTATEITYRIVVSNNGTTNLTGVKLDDVLSDFEGTAAVTSATWTHSNGTDKGEISLAALSTSSVSLLSDKTLAPGEYITVTLVTNTTATDTKTGEFGNTATADSNETGSKDSSVSIQVTEATPNVSSSKSGYFVVNGNQQSSYQLGAASSVDVVWMINVSNTGTGAATNVAVTDSAISAPYTAVLIQDGKETTLSSGGSWTIDSIAPGKTAQIKITKTMTNEALSSATSNGASSLSNTATVDGKDVTATLPVNPASAVIGFSKQALLGSYSDADKGAVKELFKITVTNSGTADAASFKVTDEIDKNSFSDLTYSVNGVDKGAYPADGVIDLSTLKAGNTATIIISGKITGTGTLSNTAGYDYDGGSGSSGTVYMSEEKINVGNLSKTADTGSIDISGGDVVYTLTYNGSNTLGSGASQIAVPVTFQDTLPTELPTGYWSISKVEVLDGNGKVLFTPTEGASLTDDTYTLENGVLTYVYSGAITSNKAVLKITYHVESVGALGADAPASLTNKAQAFIQDKETNIPEVTTSIVDKNAMKVDKFA
ncbi:MAG: hypothetical protein ACI4JQ_04010, partial [Ruminococcus sp.]